MLAVLAALASADERSCPSPPSAEAMARMRKVIDHSVPGFKNGPRVTESKLWDFEWACVDQETIIVYDPRRLADSPGRPHTTRGDGLANLLDFSDDPYYFRQASQQTMVDKLQSLGQEGAPAIERPTSTVYGYAASKASHHHEISVRLASPDEVASLRSPFSRCTTPLIFWTIWNHNLGEYLSRAPIAFLKYTRENPVLPKDLSIVLASPNKIPIPPFNKAMLRPFSSLEPSAFADFSSRLPEGTPSNSTHEGRHLRCFERLLVWRDVRDHRHRIPSLGPLYFEYYAAGLARLDAEEKLPWRDDAPGTLRVLLERRASYGRVGERQFLKLDELLSACNAPGATFGAGSGRQHGGRQNGTSSGGGGLFRRWSSVECLAWEFGKHPMGMVHDMWLMRTVDVLVTFHGAGEMNAAMFMRPQSSLIEVRGANASMSMADHWHPQMSRNSGFHYFWWGLIVQDPELAGRSGLEQEGFYADADRGNWKHFMFRKRDQNARVTWPHLSFMLGRIARVDKNVSLFRSIFGSGFAYYAGAPPHSEGVAFEVLPGERLPQRHRPAHPGMPTGRRTRR